MTRRPGYALIAVLIVIVVLSLAAYRFADAMTAEYRKSVGWTEAVQARTFANSGAHYAAGLLADPDTLDGALGGNPYDNPGYFSNQPVGPQEGGRLGGRFSLIAVADTGSGSGEGRYQVRYGVTDESGKLNINALIAQDNTGQVLYDALMKLPYMTEDVADAIVDWVDPDDTQRPSGAESAHYTGMPQPYLAKNGALNSLEELLLVRGVTPQLLFGNDRNRNGRLDPGEEDGNEFNRGWSEFLTVYGRELNTDTYGNPRVNLNEQGADAAALAQQLTDGLGEEMADYILAAKFYGTSSTPTTTTRVTVSSSGGGSTGGVVVVQTTTRTTTTNSSSSGSSSGSSSQSQTVTGGASELRAAVQNSIDTGAQLRNRITSVLTLYNTQVTLPRPPNAEPNTPTVVVPCPLNDSSKMRDLLPKLLDLTTTRTGLEMIPRVNVNTAPPEVLLGLPGMTEEYLDTILSVRQGLPATDPATTTGAWLMTEANVPAETFRSLERYITGRTMTYRVHSVGYFGAGGPTARVEAVIDTNQGHPRIVYFRDLTDLGRGFELPR